MGSSTINNISTSSDSNFGLNIGAGVDVPISKQIDFIAKAKYHVVFTSGTSTTYGGIYGGLNFNIQ